MTEQEFKMISAYPLDVKIAKTKQRIYEMAKQFGDDHLYISFSGGKDSAVLLDVARSEWPNMKAVYCDTGLEYPEVKEFVKTVENVEIIKPKKSFRQIIIDYGYPIISKEQAHFLYEIRTAHSEKTINTRLYGDSKGRFKLAKKWHYLIDAPFKISHLCCYHLKKSPFYSYNRKNEMVPILGTRATESRLRWQQYKKNGCNVFTGNHPKSQPISFWTEQDVLTYISKNNISIPSVYGEIVPVSDQLSFVDDSDPELMCTGVTRTGCMFCGFGCQREREPNRYQRLKITHPKLYDYVINGGEFKDGYWQPSNEGLGFWKVLDYINVPY